MIRRRHLLVLPLLALFAGADAPQARSARAEVDFNFGWRFQLDGTPGAAHAVSPALRTGNATRSCLRAESS